MGGLWHKCIEDISKRRRSETYVDRLDGVRKVEVVYGFPCALVFCTHTTHQCSRLVLALGAAFLPVPRPRVSVIKNTIAAISHNSVVNAAPAAPSPGHRCCTIVFIFSCELGWLGHNDVE